jgi:hypothetical protein
MLTAIESTMSQIERIQRREIALDITHFITFCTQFIRLNKAYRKLVAEYKKLNEDLADFDKLEKLMENLKPLAENWTEWVRAAQICRDISFIATETDGSPKNPASGKTIGSKLDQHKAELAAKTRSHLSKIKPPTEEADEFSTFWESAISETIDEIDNAIDFDSADMAYSSATARATD